MNEKEKKRQRIYDLLNAETKQKKSRIIGVSSWTESNPDFKLHDYTMRGVLKNKTNATSHPNIGSLKTAIEQE